MANKKKAQASTQDHLDIEDIVDDLVVLKTGWVALVMSTTAVNFDLLSEAEQDATIYAYGAFLNSLSFPLEILIRSKKADITSYFASLEEAENSQPNPDLKRQIQKYQEFVQSTVQQKTVLEKQFYLIVNFSPMEKGIGGVSGAKKASGAKSRAQLVSDAKVSLAPKRDHIIKQTSRLGLTTKQLTTKELIELFYDIYNPAPTGTQRIILDTESYTTPIVEPAVEVPVPAPEPVVQSAPEAQNDMGNLRPVMPQATPQQEAVQNPVQGQMPPISQFQTQYQGAEPPAAPAQQFVGQQPQAPLPSHQADALRQLQEATSRASQVAVGQPQAQPQPAPSGIAAVGAQNAPQPSTQPAQSSYPINIGSEENRQ